jgi:hypothetical protein
MQGQLRPPTDQSQEPQILRLPPHSLATEVVAHRLTDPESTTRALGERLVGWRDAT